MGGEPPEGKLKYRLHRQKTLNRETLDGLGEMLPSIREGGFGLDLMLSDTEFNRDVSFKDLEGLRTRLKEESVIVSCHLPYIDLRLGSRDPKAHEYAKDCLQYGLEMAADLRARIAVVHAGYSNHIPPRYRAAWMERFTEGLRDLVSAAEEEEMLIAVENTYEPDGEIFTEIFGAIESPSLKMCVDLGHAACFSRMAPEEWITTFKDRIAIMHFHDNDGQDDLHSACGEGVVGYDMVFEALRATDLSCTIALEVPDEAWETSIEHLRQVGFEFGEIPEFA